MLRKARPSPRVLVIVGPTSSGKTALSVELARKLGGEVISADSRQVYKGLDIGSGKVTKREMKGVRHHLLDVASPKTIFNANDFAEKGRAALEDIVRRGKLPIICGGTGFYIDALLGRITLPNVPPNKKLRAQLEKKTASELFAMLKKLDTRRAREIDRHNPVRLVRAIEIAKQLGKVPAITKTPLPFDVEWIGLKPDDKTLDTKIHTRLLQRMKKGMVEEVKRLHSPPAGGGVSWKRLESFGLEYRSLARFLQKKVGRSEMLTDLEKDIRNYAKRQMTYWRRNKDIRWFVDGKTALKSSL